MKKIILLLLLALCINKSHAQTRVKDSLKLLLLNEKTDTGRVLLLAALSFEYLELKPDTTMSLALEALTLSRRIGFTKGEAVSLNRVGNAYNVLGDYPKQLEVLLEALKINEKINNIDGIHRNLNNIGLAYRNQGDNRQAIEYFLKSKSYSEKAGDKRAISVVLTNIGESYSDLKIYDSALIFTQLGNNIASAIGYSRIIGNSFRILGDINSGKNQNTLALEYYRLGFPHLQVAENNLSIGASFLGMAKVFEKLGQNDSVLYYANKSYFIAKEAEFILEARDAARFLSLHHRKFNSDSAFFYQDISRAANDSIFSQQKQRQLQSLAFDEKLRQADIAAAELKDKKKRNNNLQYAGMALGLITFIILFLLLSHSIIANQKLIRFLGVIALLIVFEFINLFIHPYLSHATNDSPLIMLLVMVCIAALLVPVHHRMEKWISHRLVEKNKKIRLAAARKTIATLESEIHN